MKRPPTMRAAFLLLMLACGFVVWRATAQISVGPAGVPPITFDSLPPASQWSMLNATGAASTITSQAQMDAQVQTNAASSITNALVAAAGDPPSASGNALWASDGRYLVTRSTGNKFTAFMATLKNDTGTNQPGLLISYHLTNRLPVAEQIIGTSLYWSHTGETGTWQKVTALSGLNIASALLSTNLDLGNWPASSNLYLLWTDDNGSGTPDTAVILDNFAVALLNPVITQQPADTSIAPGQTGLLAVAANGFAPLFYQWRKDGAPIAGATNQSLLLGPVQIGDSGSYSVVVSNAYGTAISSDAAVSIGCFSLVAITGQPPDRMLQAGASLLLSVTATGTQPFTYQWQRNGVPLPGETNQTFVRSNSTAADSGLYSVVVANCAGSRQSSNAVVGIAESSYVLVGLTNHFWRYNQSGADLGTNWRAINYDDSSWPSGRGILAREDNAILTPLTNTVLDLGSPQIPTYYFRTTVVITNEPGLLALVSSNYFDDGAVVFVNGAEAFRYNMLAGFITFNTLAPVANPGGEGVFVVSNISPTLLIQGTNTFAVEVHQNALTSADIAFGMALIATPATPMFLQITNEPDDVVIQELNSASFVVGLNGTGARLQWFKDGVPIPGANWLTLTLTNAQVSDSGGYTFVASNAINIVTSRVARLVVNPDASPPALLAADLLDSTRVLAAFSKLLQPDGATNPALYSVTNTFGAVAAVTRAVVTNGTNVLLTTSPMAADANYILTAAGVPDASLQQNLLPHTAVPVARTLALVPFAAWWTYFDPYPPLDAMDPGPGWNLPGFDDFDWGYDPGAFSSGPAAPSVPVSTTLAPTPAFTAYFRTEFDSPASPGGLRVQANAAVMDGAVLYLNGVEFHRVNLPAGPVAPNTPATANALATTNLTLAETLLSPGVNLFAAELHQWQSNDATKFFGLELMARAESLLTGPLLLLGGPTDVIATEGRSAMFRLSQVAGRTFQWQLNETNLPGATNGTLTLAVMPVLHGARVRCLVSDGPTTLTTTNARLFVLPDQVRPELLGADVNADGTVTLRFSKPLDPSTAASLANYLVTNTLGASWTVTGATLANGTNVILSFASALTGSVNVTVSGVTDTVTVPNEVWPGAAARVGARYFFPMDGPWKYLLINTNDAVQAAFMGVGYDDSAWMGPSNALLYVEDATMPFAKQTPLSLFDETGTNRINTFYFRARLVTPLISTGLVMQIRHVIDDGMVLHLNGQEIYRYNMPAGTPTAATQAASVIGNAGVVGPLSITPTALVAGTNILAVEVHEFGTSLDIVMGLEANIQAPGFPLPPTSVPLARLAMTRLPGITALSWGDPGFTLEQASTPSGPWQPIAQTSPALIAPTNSAAFFRLRR